MTPDFINRDQLIKMINLIRPALSTQDYIPALKHVLFDNRGYASAYNDVAAIQVMLPFKGGDLNLCLPGEMLIKTLNSFNAEKVVLQQAEDQTLVVGSGRSKIKMPTLPAKDFPLTLPTGKAPVIKVTADILQGISMCLTSVGNDPTRPATMGVTLEVKDGKALLFATDNATISRYQSKSDIQLPGDIPIILPTFFCEQLALLSKAFPNAEIDIELHAGAMVAAFFNPDNTVPAVLFQKTLVDTEPLDFPKIIAKHLKIGEFPEDFDEIPAGFDAAFQRALLILGGEVDKATKITVLPGGEVRLLSTSSAGEAADTISFVDPTVTPADPFFVDPGLILRACRACSHIALKDRVVVMGTKSANFLHMIAHSSK